MTGWSAAQALAAGPRSLVQVACYGKEVSEITL
jgi:hypothetical protein